MNLAALGLSASFLVRFLEVKHRLINQTGVKDGEYQHIINLCALWLAEVTVVRATAASAPGWAACLPCARAHHPHR